jgi:hypothetical protein
MQPTFVYPPQHVGEMEIFLLTGVGPSSYSQTTGDVIKNPGTGENLYAVAECVTLSKTYVLRPYPSAVNSLRPTWTWKWYTQSSGSEVSNGVDLSAEKVQFMALGGQL